MLFKRFLNYYVCGSCFKNAAKFTEYIIPRNKMNAKTTFGKYRSFQNNFRFSFDTAFNFLMADKLSASVEPVMSHSHRDCFRLTGVGKEFSVIAFIVHVCRFKTIIIETIHMHEIKIFGYIFGIEFSTGTICNESVKSVVHMPDIRTPKILQFFFLFQCKFRDIFK